jgi:hypothetical protein
VEVAFKDCTFRGETSFFAYGQCQHINFSKAQQDREVIYPFSIVHAKIGSDVVIN